jgi:hypothetical protein
MAGATIVASSRGQTAISGDVGEVYEPDLGRDDNIPIDVHRCTAVLPLANYGNVYVLAHSATLARLD